MGTGIGMRIVEGDVAEECRRPPLDKLLLLARKNQDRCALGGCVELIPLTNPTTDDTITSSRT